MNEHLNNNDDDDDDDDDEDEQKATQIVLDFSMAFTMGIVHIEFPPFVCLLPEVFLYTQCFYTRDDQCRFPVPYRSWALRI